MRSPSPQQRGIGQHPHGPKKSPKLQAYSGRKELGQQLSCKVFQVALPTSSGQELVNSLQNYKRSQAYRYIYNHIYILVHVQYYLCVYMYIRSGHPKAYNVCIFFFAFWRLCILNTPSTSCHILRQPSAFKHTSTSTTIRPSGTLTQPFDSILLVVPKDPRARLEFVVLRPKEHGND